MLMPDFSKYSLALFEGNRLIYSSQDKGLRPLWDFLEQHKEKYGLILHDKIIGLAAAKLIVYSKIISEVITMTASVPAKKFLEDNGVIITACEVVTNIMTKDKSAICPGEVIALNTKAPDDFCRKIKTMLNG
jgi:hypothetical protein